MKLVNSSYEKIHVKY